MAYRISPENKDSIIDVRNWRKEGTVITSVDVWPHGYIGVDEKPELSDYDEEVGIDIDELDLSSNEVSGFSDTDWELPEDMSEEEKEKIWGLIEEGEEALEEAGWTNDGSDRKYIGPLLVEEV
jgi:hypothetical protein